MSGITNTQIYDELVDFRTETRNSLNELNGRVRENAEGLGIALDRTKRLGKEIDHHSDDKGAHGGAASRITANANVKIALIGLGGGFVGGLITFMGTIASNLQ